MPASPGRPARARRSTRTAGAAQPRRTPDPFARNAAFEALAESCTRFINGDGPRRVTSLLSGIDPSTMADYYGVGGAVSELEAEVATVLGKPAALFLPSGTMAQQATLRVHADRRMTRTIAFHPACHLESHEERAYERLHGLFGVPVGPRTEPLTAASLAQVHEPVAALVVELPQRDLGGTLPDWDELCAQVEWARSRGAAAHLDGARLWEASPFYEKRSSKSIRDVAGLFDTVYVSFYKGLGAIAGCCVAGDTDVIDELSVWRTRHGGRVFMMWPYAASALSALRSQLPAMPARYRHAVAIARGLKGSDRIEVVPREVRSPIMHLRCETTIESFYKRAAAIARTDGIWTFARPFVSEGPRLQRFEFQVGSATMSFSPTEVRDVLERMVA